MAIESDPLAPSSTSKKCFSCGWIIKYINLSATVGLSVVVGFMFAQLQYVTYQLNVTQTMISDLKEQVNTQQQSEIQNLNQKVTQTQTLGIIQMAGTFVLLTCLLTMFHMASHIRHYYEPVVQRKIIAILWMSPIYAITSFLSIVFPILESYLSIIKDFYEAYVIYTFFAFLIAVLGRGDRSVAVQVLANHADHLKQPAGCFRRCYYPPPEESPHAKANAVLLECQILVMQFVLCRPMTSIASFIISNIILPDEESNSFTASDDSISSAQIQHILTSPQFYISMLQNISVFLAFTGLLKFYHAVNSDLAWIQPFSKFLCIKGVVFMTFWQGLVIDIIVSVDAGGRWEDMDENSTNPREKAIYLQNVLICLEMLLFSIAHWCVFPNDEWKQGYTRQNFPKPGIGFSDFVSDVSLIVESSKQAKLSRRSQEGSYIHAEMKGDEYDLEALPAPVSLDKGSMT
jgi:hypothetical protein